MNHSSWSAFQEVIINPRFSSGYERPLIHQMSLDGKNNVEYFLF